MHITIEQIEVPSQYSKIPGRLHHVRDPHCLNIGTVHPQNARSYSYCIVSRRPLPHENIHYRLFEIFKQAAKDRNWVLQ